MWKAYSISNWILQIQLMEHGLKHHSWFLQHSFDSCCRDFRFKTERVLQLGTIRLNVKTKVDDSTDCVPRDFNNQDDNMGRVLSLFALFEIMISNLDIRADIELRGSGFYLCSQDYGTLCFLPSDRDIQIPHGRPLSTAWSSAECHWHRSLSNRSKSSTPATVRPLRHQPQPNKHVPCEGKEMADRNGRRYSDH